MKEDYIFVVRSFVATEKIPLEDGNLSVQTLSDLLDDDTILRADWMTTEDGKSFNYIKQLL